MECKLEKLFKDSQVVTKQKLADYIISNSNLTKKQAGLLVALFFEELVLALKEHTTMSFSSFGVFTLKQRSAKLARNFKSSDSLLMPSRKVLTFSLSKDLKQLIFAKTVDR